MVFARDGLHSPRPDARTHGHCPRGPSILRVSPSSLTQPVPRPQPESHVAVLTTDLFQNLAPIYTRFILCIL
jgi:hypothetical protein